MPPRSSRRGRGRGAGGVNSTPTGRNTASISSARSSSSRRPGAVRSPMLAKYSMSYGSPMTQLPDRNVLNGGGTIAHAAAVVFQKVTKDNQRAQRRLVAASPDPPSPQLLEETSELPEEMSELLEESEEAPRGGQKQPSDDEVDMLQGQAAQDQASGEDGGDNYYDDDDDDGGRQPRSSPEVLPEPELESPPEPELDYEPSPEREPEPEPQSEPQSERQPESQPEPPSPGKRLLRRKRGWDDEVAEAEEERDRIARDALIRQKRAADLKLQANHRHATPLMASTLGVPRSHVGAAAPATARSYIEESNVFGDASLETPVPQLPRPPRPQQNADTQQQTTLFTPAPTRPQNPLALGSATTLRPPDNRPPALPPTNRPPASEKERDRFVPQARPQKATNPLESRTDHNRQGLRPRLAAGKRDADGGQENDGAAQPQQPQERQKQQPQNQERHTQERQEQERQNQERLDQERRDQHRQDRLGAVRNWGSSFRSDFGSLWSNVGSRWSKSKTADGIWTFLKYLLLLLVVFSLGTLFWSAAGSYFRPGPNLTTEEYDAFKELILNPTGLSPQSQNQIESLLLRIIPYQRDKNGKLILDDEVLGAFKDKMLSDEDVAGILGRQLFGPKWKALLGQLKASAGSPPEPWDDWLKKNKKTFHAAIKEELPAIIKDKLPPHGASKADIAREVEKMLMLERIAIQEQMDKMQKSIHSIAEGVSKIKSSPHSEPRGMTKDDVAKLVKTVVKKTLANAKLESAAKSEVTSRLNNELHGRMNHFAFGNGVQIDISLTSPTWTIPPERSSGFFAPFTKQSPSKQRPQFIREKWAALTPWDDAGDCWCAGILGTDGTLLPADLGIQLGHLVIPEYLVVEHIDPSATVDAGATPRDFEIWAIVGGPAGPRVRDWAVASFPATYDEAAVNADPVLAQTLRNGFTKLGEFTYRHLEREGGVHAHRLSRELVTSLRAATDQLLIRAVNNHGADHTCFYRLRLYGEVVGVVENIGVEK